MRVMIYDDFIWFLSQRRFEIVSSTLAICIQRTLKCGETLSSWSETTLHGYRNIKIHQGVLQIVLDCSGEPDQVRVKQERQPAEGLGLLRTQPPHVSTFLSCFLRFSESCGFLDTLSCAIETESYENGLSFFWCWYCDFLVKPSAFSRERLISYRGECSDPILSGSDALRDKVKMEQEVAQAQGWNDLEWEAMNMYRESLQTIPEH